MPPPPPEVFFLSSTVDILPWTGIAYVKLSDGRPREVAKASQSKQDARDQG